MVPQLEDARRALSDAQTSADERTTSLEQRAWEFQRQQAELDHRLNAITQSTVSDDAVKTFESRMNTLRRLEVAHGYIGLAQQVNKLRWVLLQECPGCTDAEAVLRLVTRSKRSQERHWNRISSSASSDRGCRMRSPRPKAQLRI